MANETGQMLRLAFASGLDVTLNIGLGRGKGFVARDTVASRLRVWTKALPEILEQGYMGELVLVPNRVWFGEPLLVVQGTFKRSGTIAPLLMDAVRASNQDCIAYYVHEGDLSDAYGVLFGPDADKWGEFNVNFFSFIGDSHG